MDEDRKDVPAQPNDYQLGDEQGTKTLTRPRSLTTNNDNNTANDNNAALLPSTRLTFNLDSLIKSPSVSKKRQLSFEDYEYNSGREPIVVERTLTPLGQHMSQDSVVYGLKPADIKTDLKKKPPLSHKDRRRVLGLNLFANNNIGSKDGRILVSPSTATAEKPSDSPDTPANYYQIHQENVGGVSGATNGYMYQRTNSGTMVKPDYKVYRKFFYNLLEQNRKNKESTGCLNIAAELFGIYLFESFYSQYYGKNITEISIEDLSGKPYLVSREMESFSTIEDSLKDMQRKNGSSDIREWLNDANDVSEDQRSELERMLIGVIIIQNIMMIGDVNKNYGNLGLVKQDGKSYPVILDFLETANVNEWNINALPMFINPSLSLIGEILSNEYDTDSLKAKNCNPFYALLVKSIGARNNNNPKITAQALKELSKDILKKDFMQEDAIFWEVLDEAMYKMADTAQTLRGSNKRFLPQGALKNELRITANRFVDTFNESVHSPSNENAKSKVDENFNAKSITAFMDKFITKTSIDLETLELPQAYKKVISRKPRVLKQ